MQYSHNGIYNYKRVDKEEVKEGNEAQDTYIPMLDCFFHIKVLRTVF